MSEHNPYAAPKAVVADILEIEAAPALWNPAAAGAWSLLFTPAFGAFLHMQNWKALGQPEKAAASKKWMIGSTAFVVVATTLLAYFPVPSSKTLDNISTFSGLILLIVWYYAIGKSQQNHVAARFGKTYPRRGWAIPILTAIGIVVLFYALLTLLAILAIAAGWVPDTFLNS